MIILLDNSSLLTLCGLCKYVQCSKQYLINNKINKIDNNANKPIRSHVI